MTVRRIDINRREFLKIAAGGLFVGQRVFGAPDDAAPLVRFGMVADVHYADIDPDPAPCGVVGRRFYREGTLACLDAIEASFAKFAGPRYHVAGNHDFDCLSSEEFFSRVPNDGQISRTGYYSFVRGGVTFIVLNACFDSTLKPYCRYTRWEDTNVSPEELDWLRRELESAKGPVLVFCHQRLEDSAEPSHIVRNAEAVRTLLERSGKVKGVITGHQHKGGYRTLNGIPYYSLRALACDSGEGANSFAEVAVYPSGAFTVTGWRNAVSVGARGEFPERGVIAHRGDGAEFPENTIPAFLAAVRKGAEMVELDEWRCKTGELVVMHDPNVGRTTDGTGKLSDLSLAEIKALDAGAKKAPRFAGERVPTLEEALACFPKTGLYLNIHCKTGNAAPEVADLLRRTGRLAQGVLMMDSRVDLVQLKAKCPWVKTGLVISTPGWAKPWTEEEAWRQIRDAADIGVEFLQILPNSHCTKQQLTFLHDRGIRTTYFFANDAQTMEALVREGHDFVFTDRYSLVRGAYDAAARS